MKINWPEWANYRAMDADGRMFYFECEPKAFARLWDTTIGKCEAVDSVTDWRDSLEERPKEVPDNTPRMRGVVDVLAVMDDLLASRTGLLADEYDALTEARAAVAEMIDPWRPIKSVPTDGTRIELLAENNELDAGHWCAWSANTLTDRAWLAENDPRGEGGELCTDRGEGPYLAGRPIADSRRDA